VQLAVGYFDISVLALHQKIENEAFGVCGLQAAKDAIVFLINDVGLSTEGCIRIRSTVNNRRNENRCGCQADCVQKASPVHCGLLRKNAAILLAPNDWREQALTLKIPSQAFCNRTCGS
jgi:hypothetical protein